MAAKAEAALLAVIAAGGVVMVVAPFEAEAANVRFRGAGNRSNGGRLHHP